MAHVMLQGTKLMTPEKARGVWAIYVWCRRTDELVDGPNASRMNPRVSIKPSSGSLMAVSVLCRAGTLIAMLRISHQGPLHT